MTPLQYRIAPEGGVRDVDDKRRQVVVSIPWEVLDTYNTDFARGCFDEFFAERLPVMCWQHQRTEPIGRVRSRQATATSHEMVAGFSDFDAVPRARQAFAQIRDGEITDISFGYDQAITAPHPEVRGAARFVKARMPEISPVTIGAIPGAVAVGIRAEAEIGNLQALVDAGVLTAEGAEQKLREAGIHHRERITVGQSDAGAKGVDLLAAAIRAALDDEAAGARSLTISINDDGTVTTVPADAQTSPDDDDAATLAQAIDAALDAAARLIAGVDLTNAPQPARDALNLAIAAGVAADELLEALGLDDPDDPDDAHPGEGGDGNRAGDGDDDGQDEQQLRAARARIDKALRPR